MVKKVNKSLSVKQILKQHKNDASRLIDIIRDIQSEYGHVSDESIEEISESLGISIVDVKGVITFYHFFSTRPAGKYTVYLNNSAVAIMKGRSAVATAFEKELKCSFGEVSSGGIGLFSTSCIGMSDQEPAAIINGVVFTCLTPAAVKGLVSDMKAGKAVKDMIKEYGDGQNQNKLIRSMVNNNIMRKGPVIFAPFESGSAIKKAASLKPLDVINEVKTSNLRGRGGAGFPAGMKWEFCRNAPGKKRYVLCNADEGEPGTFKDRVILTEIPEMLFEGMAVAGYAIGASEGILYLRAEYIYLLDYLEDVLKDMRKKKLLGKNISGKTGYNFDISIKAGAGAYICGEESALIESAEGKRGEPRNRPPFPAECGYMGAPTIVNNVETFCAAARIMTEGGAWFAKMGTSQSRGTKLLSISGDCKKPGVYEVEFGMTVQTLLEEADGRTATAVLVGGPSGRFIGKSDFSKRICFDDLPTGGSVIVIGPDRDLLEIVHNFMEFFVEESCGWCVPCRAGNMILLKKLEKVMHGKGTAKDLDEMAECCKIVKSMSRCGLGQTSPNPVLTTLNNFRELYEARLQKVDFVSEFNLAAAVQDSCKAAGRIPNIEGH